MKVLFDHQIFSIQKYGGISRYFYELYKVYKYNSIDIKVGIKYTDNEYLTEEKTFNHFIGLNFPGRNKLSYKINEFTTISDLKNQYDIYHPTYYSTKAIKHKGKAKLIVTVHDLIHEKYPVCFPKNDTTVMLKKKMIQEADKVIAISNNTKKDIMDFYNVQDKKIEVIYHGNSLKRSSQLSDLKLPSRYVLFVGNRGHYKNFNTTIEAASKLLREDDDLFFICAGGGPFSNEETHFLNNNKIEKKVLHMSASNNNLVQLYSNALCFIFPSLYEGFGIPILEAMDCNCPVLLSNTSCFPEIAQSAAMYFNPVDPSSIDNSIRSVIYNDSLRQALIDKGKHRAAMFSWDKTAKETICLYEKAL